jgi:hypothetical protein
MKIFYFHIPKTGGQTLAARLASAFPIGRSDIIGPGLSNTAEGKIQLTSMLEKCDFVERHVTGALLEDIQAVDLLCTIREPISHRISVYKHVLREKDNILHRAATTMSAHDFFLNFGEFLTNQTRDFVSTLKETEVNIDPHRQNTQRLYECIDKIRWLVPTESIDEFVTLWSLEMGRHVPSPNQTRNVAPRGDQQDFLFGIVQSMPWLYASDLLLWQIAKEKFDRYRQHVLDKVQPFNCQVDSSTAYLNEGYGIWLRDGWHAPQLDTAVGTAWWAGPSKWSRVHIFRSARHQFLTFSIAVVCGVPHDQIRAVSKNGVSLLPQRCVLTSEGIGKFVVDISSLGESDELLLYVPHVCAPIMMSPDSDDTERKSFATCDWSLKETLDHAEPLSIP